MIKPGEIQKKAVASGVRDQQIEKDYVLSWILCGVAQHRQLSEAIVFKGGTVLKKVYFEDYRYSEDLDFTLLDNSIPNEKIFDWFNQSFAFVKEESNIPLAIIDHNEHDDGGINFYISYIGPLGGQGSNKKVKIDISRSEQLVFEPIRKDVFIGYTDIEAHQLLCYRLEEILVEKMRSLMQRMQARDFYDIWYLLEIHGMNVDFYLREFGAKCSIKQINHTNFPDKLKERLPQYKGRWQNSLREQIKDLPDFDQVVRQVQRHIKQLDFS